MSRPIYDGPPHFRLSEVQFRAWKDPELRKRLADWLAHSFRRSGVYVCSPTLAVIATVNPLGQVKFAVPPLRTVERWQCANAPDPQQCECQNFFDPESKRAWKADKREGHHPLCIFDPENGRRWKELREPSLEVKIAVGQAAVVKEAIDIALASDNPTKAINELRERIESA